MAERTGRAPGEDGFDQERAALTRARLRIGAAPLPGLSPSTIRQQVDEGRHRRARRRSALGGAAVGALVTALVLLTGLLVVPGPGGVSVLGPAAGAPASGSPATSGGATTRTDPAGPTTPTAPASSTSPTAPSPDTSEVDALLGALVAFAEGGRWFDPTRVVYLSHHDPNATYGAVAVPTYAGVLVGILDQTLRETEPPRITCTMIKVELQRCDGPRDFSYRGVADDVAYVVVEIWSGTRRLALAANYPALGLSPEKAEAALRDLAEAVVSSRGEPAPVRDSIDVAPSQLIPMPVASANQLVRARPG